MTDAARTDQPGARADAVLTDQTLAAWIAGQRWYAAKGLDPALRVIATVDQDVADGPGAHATVSTRFVIDDAPAVPVLYQVPLTLRHAPVDGLDAALVGTDGDRWVYDAPHDPLYARWLLETMGESTVTTGADATVVGATLAPTGALRSATVLSGEQSNTSIVCVVDGAPVERVIVKVFRALHHGDNPDVTTQAALSEGGSARVPHSYGAVTGTWPDVGRTTGTASGHLAFAQEFLPGLEDAWRVALTAAREGSPFADRAERLGAALAEVHAVLARTLPTVPAGPDEIGGAVDSMRRRLATAAQEVPDVRGHADAIGRLYDRLPGLDWPVMQRVHGDLHLGQVLAAPEPRGWVFLDFEGEPLRPMPERSRPDSPLRDVAGMLRSFDYVAGSLAHESPSVDTGTWADDAREAFLDGYAAGSGTDVRAQRALLDAFEIDKAVYEAVYEVRNRPTWVGIPVAAVARLVARSAG